MTDETLPASETTDQETQVSMTDAEIAEARSYGRKELVLTLVDKVVDLSYYAVAAFVIAQPIDGWLKQWSLLDRFATLRLMGFFILITLLHMAVSFPLSFYSGHVVEHKYGLSTLTFRGWLWRYLKRNLLGLSIGLVIMTGLFWVIWLSGSWWWLVAAGGFFLFSVILGQLAPVLILPLFYKIQKLDVPELTERMARLSEGTGLTIEGVYRMDLSQETVKANAMLAGLGRTRRVLMGDTLLNGFTPDEIEVIFAHEIGHHVFRHIRKMIVAGIVFSTAGFWICDVAVRWWAGTEGVPFDYAQLPIWTLPFIVFVLFTFSQLLEPIQNAISRHFERQSDRYALFHTGRREAYLSAFHKLAKLNKDDPYPHWLEVVLFHSHPPIGERLAVADA